MPADLSLYERIRGKRMKDIELPNDTGEVDERILDDRMSKTKNPLTRIAIRTQRLRQRAGTKRSRR